MKTETTMKTYTVTLTEEQAHAVGFAIMNKVRDLKAQSDAHSKDLVRRLEASYHALDTAPEGAA